jgi:hypothetical protein
MWILFLPQSERPCIGLLQLRAGFLHFSWYAFWALWYTHSIVVEVIICLVIQSEELAEFTGHNAYVQNLDTWRLLRSKQLFLYVTVSIYTKFNTVLSQFVDLCESRQWLGCKLVGAHNGFKEGHAHQHIVSEVLMIEGLFLNTILLWIKDVHFSPLSPLKNWGVS